MEEEASQGREQRSAAPGLAQEDRLFGLRLALALGVFELLVSHGKGLAVIPGIVPGVLYVCAPFAIYGAAGFLAGPLFSRSAARLIALVVLGAYAVFNVWTAREHFLKPGGGLDFTAVVFLLLAVLAAGWLLRARLPFRPTRLLFFCLWPAALIVAVLWATQSQPVYRASGPQSPGRGPNVVLVTWDTVRADLLSLYGGTGLGTPNLDRLARSGVTYTQAVAVAPITGPSHASMLTGLYPPSHGLRSNIWTILSPEVPTLPELLGGMGYETGAFVAAEPLLQRFGLNRGFQTYDDRMPHPFTSGVQRFGVKSFLWVLAARKLLPASLFPRTNNASVPGSTVTDRAAAWYRATQGPAFLWVHYYDAHSPYDPAERFRRAALAAEATATPRAVDQPEGQPMLTMQRGEIAFLDHELGRLLEALQAKDPGLDNTLVIVTSDHGECFGEGGIVGEHMPSLYAATQHVPLVIRFPGAAEGGRRMDAPVSHIDLAPTVLFALTGGVPEAAGAMQGMPIQVLSRNTGNGTGPVRGPLYMEAWQNGLREERKQALRSAEWKFVRWMNGTRELFGLRDGERMVADPARADAMAAALQKMYTELPKAQGTDRQVSSAEEQMLREWGYMGDEE